MSIGLHLPNNLSYMTVRATPSPPHHSQTPANKTQVPAVFITTCLLPHTYAVATSGVYDNANPRGLRDAIGKSPMDKSRQERLLRAKGASDNGFESLGLYAAGVVAANQAGVAAGTVNALSLGYLVCRVAYVYAYVELGGNRRLAGLRSVCWAVSAGLCLALWVKAGLGGV
ncbi:hypothetical protein E4U53_000283 [Claviceps sorghi]|nr:hypothetical protein E4U53_000283 [Claviceps sorghi]